MATYHEAQLAVLVAHVGEAVDRFRAGELHAFGVDEVLYQYSRAAKELEVLQLPITGNRSACSC